MDYQPAPQGKDPHLWNIARRRASFKTHAVVYLLVNGFLWILWYRQGAHTYNSAIPWPAWSTLGWGIGLVSHYMGAYVTNGDSAIEREYKKLQNQNNK